MLTKHGQTIMIILNSVCLFVCVGGGGMPAGMFVKNAW